MSEGPLFTVILTSHRKPQFVGTAINSVLEQTCTDWELLIVDSGWLFDDLAQLEVPGKIRVVRTGETEALRQSVQIVSWVLNRFIPEARGRYLIYLCDDDVLLPSFLAAFAAALEPDVECYWTGIEMRQVDLRGQLIRKLQDLLPDGQTMTIGQCGSPMLCQSKRTALEIPWPEERATEHYADGLLMQRLAAKYRFKAVPGIHLLHQRTPLSAYSGPG